MHRAIRPIAADTNVDDSVRSCWAKGVDERKISTTSLAYLLHGAGPTAYMSAFIGAVVSPRNDKNGMNVANVWVPDKAICVMHSRARAASFLSRRVTAGRSRRRMSRHIGANRS
jgi:hypothetical protein